MDRIVDGKLLSRARRHDSFWHLPELDNFPEIRCQIVGFSRSGYRRLSSRRGCGRNLGEIFRMTNIRYTNAQRLKALEVFDRTQSATKTVRELGYPGRWTLHRWIRQRREPPSPPIRRTTLKRYPSTTKLKAVELFNSGMSPEAVAAELSLNSKMSVYAWAQRFREEGKWGVMSATERKQSAGIVSHKALASSLPDDAVELKKLAARLSAEKAVLEKELEEIKKRRQHRPNQSQ